MKRTIKCWTITGRNWAPLAYIAWTRFAAKVNCIMRETRGTTDAWPDLERRGFRCVRATLTYDDGKPTRRSVRGPRRAKGGKRG